MIILLANKCVFHDLQVVWSKKSVAFSGIDRSTTPVEAQRLWITACGRALNKRLML